jgi:hypothetical protein
VVEAVVEEGAARAVPAAGDKAVEGERTAMLDLRGAGGVADGSPEAGLGSEAGEVEAVDETVDPEEAPSGRCQQVRGAIPQPGLGVDQTAHPAAQGGVVGLLER